MQHVGISFRTLEESEDVDTGSVPSDEGGIVVARVAHVSAFEGMHLLSAFVQNLVGVHDEPLSQEAGDDGRNRSEGGVTAV